MWNLFLSQGYVERKILWKRVLCPFLTEFGCPFHQFVTENKLENQRVIRVDKYREKLRQIIEDTPESDKYVIQEFANFLEEKGMPEWEVAKEWNLWRCFWCDFATEQTYVRAGKVKCHVKNRYFKDSYHCKTHFELQVNQKRFLLCMKWITKYLRSTSDV